jgi:hypothetical protein
MNIYASAAIDGREEEGESGKDVQGATRTMEEGAKKSDDDEGKRGRKR